MYHNVLGLTLYKVVSLSQANVTMNKIATSLMAICIISGNLIQLGDAKYIWTCTPCKSSEDCDHDPNEFCLWDEVRDNCGRRVCGRGPGDRCGGPMDMYGKCAAGLMCKPDEKCHGCAERDSIFECFPNF